jgi:hypothetical protein
MEASGLVASPVDGAIVSSPGAFGALKIVYYNLPAWLVRDKAAVERRKQAALRRSAGEASAVYLNCLVRAEGRGDEPITIALRDSAGEMGAILIDGARMTHEEADHDGSNSLFAYFEQRICRLCRERDPKANVQIVQWATIDDAQAAQYP